MQRPRDYSAADDARRYREIFDDAPVALWDEDFSAVVTLLQSLRAKGVQNIRGYFEERPDDLADAVNLVTVRDGNRCAAELFEAQDKKELLGELGRVFLPETNAAFLNQLAALWEGHTTYEGETVVRTLKGRRLDVAFTVKWRGAQGENTLVSVMDVSARRTAERRAEALTRAARILTSDLDLERIVQALTDVATELSNAEFGAFFYNVTDEKGERYVLYTLSGVAREKFSQFPLPRNTLVFDPTFKGEGIVRSDDITKDPRYGKNAPHYGMPKGHLPVVSYLAIPVVARSGEVHGGLFLGHQKPGVFTAEIEDVLAAIAQQAGVAIDNAHLMREAKREIVQRRDSQQASQRLAAIVQSSDDAIISKDLNGIITSWNNGAEQIFGYTPDEVIGKSVTMLMPPDRLNEEPGILAHIRSGQRIEHYETVRRRKDGTLLDISLTVSPLRNEDGVVIGASKIARDISDRKKMEKQREFLMAELSHRVKNTLATVVSIERLTFSGKEESPERASFRARIQSLAHAHGRLAESNWMSVSLQQLLEDELAPYRNAEKSNVSLSGPAVSLSARCGLSLGLGIHELVTNCAKYGALSTPSGRVDVSWRKSGEGAVELIWNERGGPVVKTPSRTGFGRLLLEQALSQELGCTVKMDFHPEGLRCSITIPSTEHQSFN